MYTLHINKSNLLSSPISFFNLLLCVCVREICEYLCLWVCMRMDMSQTIHVLLFVGFLGMGAVLV